MAKWRTSYRAAAPLAAVIPAGIAAARTMDYTVTSQAPTTLECKGSWLRLFGNRATVRVSVMGVDGAADVFVEASNFGVGPINEKVCREAALQFLGHLVNVLMVWYPAGAPGPRPTL
jgi:hypothetical protein